MIVEKGKTLLCKLGIHRPLKVGYGLFTDIVTGNTVREATCPCGKKWMTDSVFGWFGFKTKREVQSGEI